MSEVTLLFCVSALYLLFGAWVISRTGRSRMGTPVKVQRNRAQFEDGRRDKF